MKLIFSAIIIASLIASAFAGEKIAPIRSLALKSKTLSTRKTNSSNWKTDYGSYDRDTSRQKSIEYTVRNFSKDPAPEVIVTTYWLVTYAWDKELSLYQKDVQKYDIEPGTTVEAEILSPETRQNEMKLVAIGEHWKEGARMEGYVVAIKYQGEFGETFASTSKLRDLARNPEKLEKMKAETKSEPPPSR